MADPKLLELLADGRETWNGHQHRRLGVDALPPYENLSGADLRGRDLRNYFFHSVDFRQANLAGARLNGARLVRLTMEGADLTNADLARTRFLDADCRRAQFGQVYAAHSAFNGVLLDGADFADSSFHEAVLRDVSLQDASFCACDLTAAVFLRSNFTRSDFTAATFHGTSIGLSTLAQARGLAAITHAGPSALDIHTLIHNPDLPERFLTGIGLPDALIAYYHSLATSESPIQFYSCFISYSSKDGDFCRRLHNDLQAAGVRCWFAPEDLKIGDRARTRIEESIRVYDKLLIVLSEHSIRSPWVEHEIEAAFEKERQRKATVLFPIRVDDAVMDTNQAWAASIRRERHIGNFTGWKEYDSYQKAFERLMRDLRASGDPAPNLLGT